MSRKESQGGLELSAEDYKYFTNMLQTNGCTERRISEIISKHHKYITPEIVELIRLGNKSISDYIFPEGALHDM